MMWKYCIWMLLLLLADGLYGQTKPALLPLPQQLIWKDGGFQIHHQVKIIVNDQTLRKELEALEEIFPATRYLESPRVKPKTQFIDVQLTKIVAPMHEDEAYSLHVEANKIEVKANTKQGVFYAIQTLKQLSVNGRFVPACDIIDWPAFAWRGYLVDVGRNYQSMELLKQQIDVMAFYKLNIFHFHFTEDIAWRLASELYPALTRPDNMLRDAGKYYKKEELQSLINYCKERYITFIPEIDMPGHSAAFRRAMRTDMQTEQGMMYMKNILKEFCDTYEDVPYIHIGGDEVKITNTQFLPDMTKYLEDLGKETIGWDPGGNLSKNTIRQLWMGGPKPISDTTTYRYIDSKHLYINHMDPLETVVTLFNRQIGGQKEGNRQLLGGILCSWPDRAVASEKDVLLQNAVYPGIITFAERSWCGGGQPEWVCNIKDPSSYNADSFRKFEERLLMHKEHYFKEKPFPYVKQTGLVWQFYGPYSNGGKLDRAFEPEIEKQGKNGLPAAFKTDGGTFILRHWWADILPGLIVNPKEYTTWYARTEIWSDKSGDYPFWIGFDNFSRSYATDSPVEGTWDNRSSNIWVNGKVILPPNWKQAGMKGDLEKPMIDEGYTFREPTKVSLKKGWNTVLVKLPIGRFQGKDWQNPVKWMFTFVPLK